MSRILSPVQEWGPLLSNTVSSIRWVSSVYPLVQPDEIMNSCGLALPLCSLRVVPWVVLSWLSCEMLRGKCVWTSIIWNNRGGCVAMVYNTEGKAISPCLLFCSITIVSLAVFSSSSAVETCCVETPACRRRTCLDSPKRPWYGMFNNTAISAWTVSWVTDESRIGKSPILPLKEHPSIFSNLFCLHFLGTDRVSVLATLSL